MWSVFRSLFGKKPEDGRKILPAGDCALVVEFGNEINEALNRKVQCLNEKVAAAHVKGIVETVPTFRSLMVTYDPSEISFEQLKKELSGISVEDLQDRRHLIMWWRFRYATAAVTEKI